MTDAARTRSPGRPLAWFAVAVVVGHHVGTIFKPLGTVGATEWADWIDFLVPISVLGTAATALAAAAPTGADWVRFGAGALVYTQGQALHLGANSISNAGVTGRAEDAAHLWDEVVSHYLWYAGLAVVVLALLLALVRAGQPGRVGIAAYLLAALFGFTFTTNGIEGGTVPMSLPIAAALLALGLRQRATTAGRLVVAAYAVAVLLIAGWGVWHRGFPQFSELGWI